MPTPLIFFGNERIATGVTTKLPVLHELVAQGHTLDCIVLHQSSNSHGRKQRELEVEQFASEHDIEIFIPSSQSELLDRIAKSGAELGVLVAYGKIISQEVIDAFPRGIVNLHPSLLPKYRGPTPLESFMLSDDTRTGFSIMQLGKGMDDGPIFRQVEYTPKALIEKQELADELGKLGAQNITAVVADVLSNKANPVPQSEDATYTSLFSKELAQLNPKDESAEILERKVRAYAYWPGAYVIHHDTKVSVMSAELIARSGEPGTFFIHEKELAVFCSTDALILHTIKPEGKKEMASRDYLLGHPL